MFFVIDPDKKYQQTARLDFYIKTASWKEQMLSETGGDFTITLGGEEARNFVSNNMIIENTKGFKKGVITSIVYKMADRQIEEIEISGKMLESIFCRRTIRGQMQLEGTTQQIITDILNRNVINTTISESNLPMKLKFIDALSDEQTYIAEDGETVAKCLYNICLTINAMYYFTIENGELVLNFKKQSDKSHILFASDASNIYDVQTKETIEGKANAAIVKGDIVNSSIPYVYVADKAAKGFHWIETFIDKSSEIDSENVEESTYLKAMKQIGRENLATYQIRRAFDSATMDSKYSYPDEIFLGDVVTVDVNYQREPQRIVNYFYTLSGDNKEEISFTLSQVPVVVTDIDNYVVYGDVPKEDLDDVVSDATSEGANPSGGGGGGAQLVGRVLCIDDERVDGTITKLKDGVYRLHIFTWNSNPISIVENEDGTTSESTTVKPYVGHIYFLFPNDLLSYINQNDGIVYIDNNDGSKTKINIGSAYKGVIFADQFDPDHGLLFENPTEDNAGADVCYRYEIESENMNFNFTADISIEPVKNLIPLKPYSKTLKVNLFYAHGNGYKANDYNYYDYFLPETFWADEGDYIKLVCNYCELTHTNDPDNPYVPGEWQEREFIWYFQEGELVKDKVIRLPEGGYDFNNGSTWGWSSSFKKLKYLKKVRASSNNRAGYYGNLVFGCKNSATAKPINSDINECFLVKQNPAFDTLEGLDAIRWIWCSNKTVNKIKVPKYESPYYGNYQLSLVTSTGGDNLSVLENICDPTVWAKILAENPDMFTEE